MVSLQFALNELSKSNEFQLSLRSRSINPDSFSYKVLSPKYRNEAIDILCYQFSKMGGNYASEIFNTSISDIYVKMSHVVNHAINTKLSYIVLDKSNKIATISILFDITDYPTKLNLNLLSLSAQKRFELVYSCNNTLSFIKSLHNNIKYGLIKHGDGIEHYLTAIRPDLVSKGYIIFPLMFYAVSFHMGYKYNFAGVTHLVTINLLLHKLPLFINNLMKTEICFSSKLNLYEYFEKKFERDKWYRNNLNQKYILNMVKDVYFGGTLCRCDAIAEKYNMQEFWVKLDDSILSKRSKL